MGQHYSQAQKRALDTTPAEDLQRSEHISPDDDHSRSLELPSSPTHFAGFEAMDLERQGRTNISQPVEPPLKDHCIICGYPSSQSRGRSGSKVCDDCYSFFERTHFEDHKNDPGFACVIGDFSCMSRIAPGNRDQCKGCRWRLLSQKSDVSAIPFALKYVKKGFDQLKNASPSMIPHSCAPQLVPILCRLVEHMDVVEQHHLNFHYIDMLRSDYYFYYFENPAYNPKYLIPSDPNTALLQLPQGCSFHRLNGIRSMLTHYYRFEGVHDRLKFLEILFDSCEFNVYRMVDWANCLPMFADSIDHAIKQLIFGENWCHVLLANLAFRSCDVDSGVLLSTGFLIVPENMDDADLSRIIRCFEYNVIQPFRDRGVSTAEAALFKAYLMFHSDSYTRDEWQRRLQEGSDEMVRALFRNCLCHHLTEDIFRMSFFFRMKAKLDEMVAMVKAYVRRLCRENYPFSVFMIELRDLLLSHPD